MPSTRLTKINIDRNQLEMLQTMAALKGISTTTLLEQIILFYLRYNGKTKKEAV